ncbi:MAG TPA: isoleucine--tRNA ligase [Bacteroidales bacterium]|nr:isoleucine--tRNA ligase [Bacteroidales bacterium]HPT10192.1 isoleucine--tRNA ligase [Bacteroidales bacterium]
MKAKYPEYKHLDLTRIGEEIQSYWQEHHTFEKSLEQSAGHQPFIFYEGPPSANGIPGIHHVMARSIKDIFCRYKTMKGFYVSRKAGWDTHGLPIEIGVEKKLGITKEDIGKSISIADYNRHCRSEVMKYKDLWDDLTVKMGYWLNLDDPYITYENKYIETVWHLLSRLYEKGLIYKGYTIQPYSPAAGTGLSTHELNQPGTYKMVKDNTVVAQFKVIRNPASEFLFKDPFGDLYFLAWTTTPWTLPSNTGLAMGKEIIYVLVKTYNPYTFTEETVILAKELLHHYFPEKNSQLELDSYHEGDKNIPYQVIAEYPGKTFENLRFEQLLPYAQPEDGDPFRVVLGDFVTTEDGTGIVHIAPSFGADDFRVGKQYGLGSLTLVNKQGKFTEQMGEFAGRYVKPEYDADCTAGQCPPVDIDLIVKLKHENKAFKSEKYEHSYPHCWRTDKPILYYPLDSWFIRTTACKEQMIALNKTITWKPESTGTGRFGNWLENLVDWNLSRSRFWGTPLPIWRTADGSQECCIGSVEQLKAACQKAVEAGVMKQNPLENYRPGDLSEENYHSFDLHRPFVDDIILVADNGQPMYREPDLIDVWFDSGAMPYAQYHYPFEKEKPLDSCFPADFIAEGVDQTRGWFFTLHAIAVMLFDSVSFRTCVSNGLVLDKNGNKMSKRLGNAVDPFETIGRFGADATRWYMITNSQPWDNLKFDLDGIEEIRRKFFGTLYNTYAFFALYANIDGFTYSEPEIPLNQRPEIDRWILSELNSLIRFTDECYADYEPTKAGRAISDFVDEHLSNWYVRLSRRRFWKGDYSGDKISAYQTLYQCLEVIARIASPIAPFFMERLYLDLNNVTCHHAADSVHLTRFPAADLSIIDKALEERMEMAQKISSMVLSIRKKTNLRVRQPLNRILIPLLNEPMKEQVEAVKNLILSEVNVKSIEYITDTTGILTKRLKPDFKKLGPRFGKQMKQLAALLTNLSQQEINSLEREGKLILNLEGAPVEILTDEVEILSEDIPGWQVASMGTLTVALDITVTPELWKEGIAREVINRIQNLRKEKQFEVTDKIIVKILSHPEIDEAVNQNISYICSETLAQSLEIVSEPEEEGVRVELTETIETRVSLRKLDE